MANQSCLNEPTVYLSVMTAVPTVCFIFLFDLWWQKKIEVQGLNICVKLMKVV